MKLWMYRLRIYNRRGELAGQAVGLIQAETEEKAGHGRTGRESRTP